MKVNPKFKYYQIQRKSQLQKPKIWIWYLGFTWIFGFGILDLLCNIGSICSIWISAKGGVVFRCPPKAANSIHHFFMVHYYSTA
jgi:hypothetical protein